MSDLAIPNLHDDVVLFREAVNFTASKTGFNARLIEKDYFCTVLLAYLTRQVGDQLIFKGGTCLAKVHAGFYRLSEDLDFMIPLPVDASRARRRQAITRTKQAIVATPEHLPALTVTKPLTGANNSTQYVAAIAYESPTTGQPESILIEIGLREPLLIPSVRAKAKTVLLDPINGQAMVSELAVNCIAWEEAIAEKLRAALSRRDVAIRDFYDLDHAVTQLAFDITDARVLEMVRQKLTVPDNLEIDMRPERIAALVRQLHTRLRTVLRDREFNAFDLARSIRMVATIAEQLA